jgi:RES domain-containing protein
MELNPPTFHLNRKNMNRLIPSRFPPVGILDAIASPGDLDYLVELEGWTNDRISSELGLIRTIPAGEWVVGLPHSTIIMAAYCHPYPTGGRFNDGTRGAWYCAMSLETAIRETVYNRTKELTEIGVFDTSVQMRQYVSDFDATFHDVRASPTYDALHDPDSYIAGQTLARSLLGRGSNGVLYRSVRHVGGECVACFRPPLVLNVRQGAHFEYRWSGQPEPEIVELSST